MTKEEGTRDGAKSMIKSLEVSLQQIEEIERLQWELRKAYKVPYPVPFKYNLAATVMLYIVFKQGMPYGGWILLGWLGWQICINGIYFMFQLYKKMPQIAQWKDKVNTNLEQLETNCVVPQKYWYSNAIQHFVKYLELGKAKTIEECIEIFEED